MSVDGQDGAPGGAGGDVGEGTLPARQVPAQREGGGRHAAPGSSGADLPPSDADLIARMRGGDDGAYEELFRRHADAVRRYARTCCRDGHTADDLTAEVFARTLQAVRGGAGPDHSVRAYLLTTVRRVAAAWAKTARREQLVEDFAVFAEQAAMGAEGALSGDDTLELGADVRAMHEAEQSLALQAFRSLPERWQAVLWHTTVEEASPSAIAPLFGLSANATAVLASRAREGLKQAYLQAHVSSALSAGGDCARYADRLGAYARGGLRMRAERGLRKHLEECAQCRLAAGELKDVNAGIPALLPVAVIGWFAAGYAAKAAGVVAGGVAAAGAGGAAAAASGGGVLGAGGTAGVGGAAGAGGAAAAGGAAGAAGAGSAGGAGGAAGGAGGAGGAAVSEGLGLPAKAAIAAGIAVAAAAGVVFALAGDESEPPERALPAPSAVAPLTPKKPASTPPATLPPGDPAPAAPGPVPAKPSAKPSVKPSAKPSAPPASRPAASVSPSKRPPSPTPSRAKPSPPPSPAPAEGFRLASLGHAPLGSHTGPEVETWRSSWVWQRWGLEVGGRRFAQGITVHSRSSVEITLNRQCASFSARAGVDGLSLLTDGRLRFSVYADGQRLWRSEALGYGDLPAAVAVPLTGRKSVRLVVEQVGQGHLPTLASWADAVISCR
ncbi:sigma-70 family RNA polymerase sigma factor [Streptomyces sp. RerS4]|uniref:sigma-70 family RNA polymerase sigma factor n=1 Tax=Streptomyces sp. RerS4 TaxID=2942449 RepID=UPI00201C8753|nr:sigma-70 family RNA polymerase sigma factor [Streptomyces sp. RerS4]UQX02168.1 sigma-70 family RNA polymerase sigma factor [Streptomyces sp. RerS4]